MSAKRVEAELRVELATSVREQVKLEFIEQLKEEV
jgi:hypothetical protein